MSIDDELESLRLSALYEMGDDGFVTDVELGVNNSVREKSHSSDENFCVWRTYRRADQHSPKPG